MNRKERRNMQAKLGLNKYYGNQSYTEKFKRYMDNIASGNQIKKENDEKQQISFNEQIDKKYNTAIAELRKIFIKYGHSDYDAGIMAQKICDKSFSIDEDNVSE